MQKLGDGAEVPDLRARLDVVVDFARTLRALGPAANFVYGDADALFVHAHRRRPRPGADFCAPGLHLLQRTCPGRAEIVHSPALRIRATERPQCVQLVASVPLTDEAWEPIGEGEVLVLRAGAVVERVEA